MADAPEFLDEGEFAEFLANLITDPDMHCARYVKAKGWSVHALDIGELNIITEAGLYRLSVTFIKDA